MVFSELEVWEQSLSSSSPPSHDFKGMLEIMLRQKPELSPEQIRDMIDEKKRKVGAGYLTDQGALFLVAADDQLPRPTDHVSVGHDFLAFDHKAGARGAPDLVKAPGSVPHGLLTKSGDLHHRPFWFSRKGSL